ncbi:MAG TPA: sigma-70 family RNA polymerase sigma factor, partial [Pseudonocardiaceae bacterium]
MSEVERGVADSDVDDRELLRRVRAGEDAAFAELFSRHAGVARGFALRYATDAAEADDIAAEAFFRVLQAVRRGAGPDDNVRGYLLTVVRRLAAEWRTRRRDVPVADEELSRRVDPDADQAGTRAEAHLIARAFTSLPQRWRRVLWQVEVEGERPAVVAPRFGLSPNATAALARRAREGLRAAYLQAHVPPATGSSACRAVVDKLGAYTAGLVRGSEAQRIVAHLATCSSCRAVHAELADVCAGLRRYAGSLPGLMPATALGHGLGGKSMALAGKAASFGVRFKLAIATMSVVTVGGLGVTAGPLLLHT